MSDARPVIKVVVRVAGVVLGGLFFTVMIGGILQQTPFFLQADFQPFSEDAKAYLLKQPAAKSLDELRATYGRHVVLQRITDPPFDLLYLPSEDAAFLNLLANEQYMRRTRDDGIPVVVDWAIVLVCIYCPLMFAARQTQRAISWVLCRTERFRRMRAAYFNRLQTASWVGTFLGFALTVLLSALAALRDFNPEYELPVFELAVARLLLSYLGGMWMKLVSYLADVGSMLFGRDPDATIWDEAIALAVVSPLLVLVYHNSLSGVVMSATAGLASGLYRKWKQRKKTADGNVAAAPVGG